MSEELRKLAEAATPGPWEARGWGVYSATNNVAGANIQYGTGLVAQLWDGGRSSATAKGEADAAYIAAVSPEALLTLLDALDRARSVACALEEELAAVTTNARTLLDLSTARARAAAAPLPQTVDGCSGSDMPAKATT